MAERPQNREEVHAWRRALDALVADIEGWCNDRQWITRRDTVDIQEEATGTYAAPVLTIQMPRGRLMVEPVGLYVAGMGPVGRVDIYGPNLNEMLLTEFADGWRVLDANRVQLAARFDESVFDSLAQALTAAA